MMNIVLCDDDKLQSSHLRKTLTMLLDLRGMAYHMEVYDCGESLLASDAVAGCDLFFLDIEMKSLNGIETAKHIRACNKRAVIVFVTAYPDFVFQGYEVKALNYILKPYKTEKIAEILWDALETLAYPQETYFSIEVKSGVHKLPLNHTFYFSSEKRKVQAVYEEGSLEFYYRLDCLAEKLPDFFVRVHQRYLVNINFVSVVEGNYVIVHGEKLPVSRNYQNGLMIRFAKTMLQ